MAGPAYCLEVWAGLCWVVTWEIGLVEDMVPHWATELPMAMVLDMVPSSVTLPPTVTVLHRDTLPYTALDT